MLDIKEALKNVVTNLGGTSTAKTVKGIINEIAENVSGSGGGSDYIVNLINGVPDKTFSEISNAFNDGQNVVAIYHQGSNGILRYENVQAVRGNMGVIVGYCFSTAYMGSYNVEGCLTRIIINNDDTYTHTSRTFSTN